MTPAWRILVKQVMDTRGRIDVLISNAGILRDKSFAKMELKDFDAVMAVHVMGTVKPAKAMWDIMKTQQYGRIVVTTSSTGLYGNFGQTNYGTAKLGLVGFMNSLKLEGAKDNIKVNAICPVAGTRMTENSTAPPEMIAAPQAGICDAGRRVPRERRRADWLRHLGSCGRLLFRTDR